MMTDETAKVFCPYCKNPMWKHTNGYGAWWYECNCGAATPIVGNEEKARTIALDYHNRADVDEICELKDRVENLTLYLKEAFDTDVQLYDWLDKRHPGLPGYAPEK